MTDSGSTLAYLDTCIVSGLAKEDLPVREQNALREIVRLHKKGEVTLVTSEVVKEEIDKVPVEARGKHEVIYSLLSNIPTASSERTDSGLLLMGVGGGRRKDPVLKQIEDILPDRADAEHVFQAVKSKVRFLITTDERTILRYQSELEAAVGIKAVSPSSFTAALRSSSSSR